MERSLADVALVIVAAGSGTRLGCDGPKAFVELAGRPLLTWCVLRLTPHVAQTVVVGPPTHLDQTRRLVEAAGAGDVSVVAGGASRTASVRAGLAVVRSDLSVVAVHDAARPLVDASVLRRCVEALGGPVVASAPALLVSDTIKEVDPDGLVRRTVDRGPLRAVQTPQVFVRSHLVRAHQTGEEATDDLGLVERAGGAVALVAGSAAAMKITLPADLVMAAAFVAEEVSG